MSHHPVQKLHYRSAKIAEQMGKKFSTDGKKVLNRWEKTSQQMGNNCSADEKKLLTYNKLYNKDNSKEDNKLYNTISPNGESESDDKYNNDYE